MTPNEWRKSAGRTAICKRIYLIEDDGALRLWLGRELQQRGFEVATFDSVHRFLQAADALPSGCVLSHLRGADGDGFTLLEGLKGRRARFPVILMSACADIPVAVRAMKAGAADFVEKPFSGAVITAAIEAVQQRFFQDGSQADAEAVADAACQKLALLTPREREVLDGILAGAPNKKIAGELGISQRTVELHRAHLMEKLGLRNVTQVVRLALAASGQTSATDLQF